MEPMDIDDEYEQENKDNDEEEYKCSKTNNKNKNTNIKKRKSLGGRRKVKTDNIIHKDALNVEFNEYFEAFRINDEFMINENEKIKKFDFNVESFNQITDEIGDSIEEGHTKKSKNSTSLLREFYITQLDYENKESLNKISEYNLYDLMVELLTNNSNIFLYGFGSKLNLIYNFIKYFQENVNGRKDFAAYHILIFNCFNPEYSLKDILNDIQAYVIDLFETQLDFKGIRERPWKHRTIEDQIQTIHTLIQQLELKDFQDKFLIIFNNIEGPNFMNKMSQGYLSNISNLRSVNVIATCDNTNLVYLWNQMIKDNFAFYFLKFHTFEPYDVEISDSNSLCGEKSLKSGAGILEIFKSLSKAQKDIIKTLAELQLKEDYDKMTVKGLVDYFLDTGTNNCLNQNKLSELINEPESHNIIVRKTMKNNNKDILKLNLDKEIIQRILDGDYD